MAIGDISGLGLDPSQLSSSGLGDAGSADAAYNPEDDMLTDGGSDSSGAPSDSSDLSGAPSDSSDLSGAASGGDISGASSGGDISGASSGDDAGWM